MRKSFYGAALLLLLLPACGDPLESGSLLDRARLLGVRVEIDGDPTRASPAPGETANLRWFVASPDDSLWSGAVTACAGAPNQTGFPSCVGEPFGVSPSGAPSLEPVTTLTLPGVDAFAGGTGDVLLLGVFCANGLPTVDGCSEGTTVSEIVTFTFPASLGVDPPNHHPSIADEAWSYDEMPWDPPPADVPATGCASAPSDASFPHVVWREEDDPPRIGITTHPDDREPYLELVFTDMMATRVEAREELSIAHVATAGRYSRPQTDIFSDERLDVDVPWAHPPRDEVPADGLTVEMIAVMRDGRGGMDWTRRALCLMP